MGELVLKQNVKDFLVQQHQLITNALNHYGKRLKALFEDPEIKPVIPDIFGVELKQIDNYITKIKESIQNSDLKSIEKFSENPYFIQLIKQALIRYKIDMETTQKIIEKKIGERFDERGIISNEFPSTWQSDRRIFDNPYEETIKN